MYKYQFIITDKLGETLDISINANSQKDAFLDIVNNYGYAIDKIELIKSNQNEYMGE